MSSIFADYSDDWFIPFVGDDVVANCISNSKNKAAFDTQKGANLGLKCARMRLAAGLCPDPLGELQLELERHISKDTFVRHSYYY